MAFSSFAEKGRRIEIEARREKVLVRGRKLGKWVIPAVTSTFGISILPTEYLLSSYCVLDTVPVTANDTVGIKRCAVQWER